MTFIYIFVRMRREQMLELEEKSRDNGSRVPHAEHIFGMSINQPCTTWDPSLNTVFAMAADQGTDRSSGPRFVCYTTDTGETRMFVPILVSGDLDSYITYTQFLCCYRRNEKD